MAVIDVTYYTDPACPWSWAAEPALRRIESEFGEQVRITYVMVGLARELARPEQTALHVLDAAAASGMPVDARLWLDGPPRSSHPACIAVKAAAEQGLDGPYLRVLREGMMLRRRALDTLDALGEAARGVPGLDGARFALDLRSDALAEAFGADLDRARAAAAAGQERVSIPAFAIGGEPVPAAGLADAVRAAGAASALLPDPAAALQRSGVPLATPEIAAACDLPGPRAAAELWRLALEFRVRAERVGSGELWSVA